MPEKLSDSSASLATKQELQASIQQRYPKVWDDHGPIAGRGHIMVLFSCLYDPAFYFVPRASFTPMLRYALAVALHRRDSGLGIRMHETTWSS